MVIFMDTERALDKTQCSLLIKNPFKDFKE